MRFASYVSTAVVALALSANAASAGFNDFVSDDGAAVEQNLSALVDQTNPLSADSEPQLTLDFSTTSDDERGVTLPPLENGKAPSAVTAPLPPALIPGAFLLAGNFVLTRVLKRRIK